MIAEETHEAQPPTKPERPMFWKAHHFSEKHFGLKGTGKEPGLKRLSFLSDDTRQILARFRSAKGTSELSRGFHLDS